MKIKIICICLALVLSTSFLTVATHNDTIYVDDDGTADYTNIQEAVNAANDGDTVYVYPGTYYGLVTIDKTVTLTGENAKKTIIDGEQLGEDTITVNANTCHISGFTIKNSPRGYGYNSGLKLYHAHNCTIEHMVFTDNCWAAEIRDSENCMFKDNQIIDNVQGGVHLVFADTAVVKDCIFNGNERRGLQIFKGNDQIIMENTFIDCGIDMGAQPPPGNTMHCTITDNTVNGKPLVYLEQEQGKIINDAGQVILNQCKGIIIRNLDIANTSTGISIYKSSYIFVMGNTVTNNFHGISIGKSFFVTLRNNDIMDNWYNGIGLNGNILTNIYFNEITGNDIGLYVHQSPLAIPFLNRNHDNTECNLYVTTMFLPCPIKI